LTASAFDLAAALAAAACAAAAATDLARAAEADADADAEAAADARAAADADWAAICSAGPLVGEPELAAASLLLAELSALFDATACPDFLSPLVAAAITIRMTTKPTIPDHTLCRTTIFFRGGRTSAPEVQNSHPAGAGGQAGSGTHPGGGLQPAGTGGQCGGGLKFWPDAGSSPRTWVIWFLDYASVRMSHANAP
jgi:hypothetical protein